MHEGRRRRRNERVVIIRLSLSNDPASDSRAQNRRNQKCSRCLHPNGSAGKPAGRVTPERSQNTALRAAAAGDRRALAQCGLGYPVPQE